MKRLYFIANVVVSVVSVVLRVASSAVDVDLDSGTARKHIKCAANDAKWYEIVTSPVERCHEVCVNVFDYEPEGFYPACWDNICEDMGFLYWTTRDQDGFDVDIFVPLSSF